MKPRLSLTGWLAWLVMGLIFLPLLPGFIIMATPLLAKDIWLAVWFDNQWFPALLSTLVSTLISVGGSLLLTLIILCGLWPGPRWQRYTRRLPLFLAFPHVAFASGFLFLFSDNGWLARLLAVSWPVDTSGVGLGVMLACKEAWFLLWFASIQLNRHQLERQLTLCRSLGYGPLQSRLLVIVPQLLPRLGRALIVITAWSLSVVDVATILGPGNPPTLAVLAWQWMNHSEPVRQAMGMALSLTLVLLLMLFVAAGLLLMRLIHQRHRSFSGSRHRADIRLLADCLSAGMSLLGLATIVILLLWSLAQSWFYPAAFPGGLTLSGWQQSAYPPLITGLALALASGSLAAFGVLIWLEGVSRRFDNWLLLPLLLPALPLAAGQYQVLLRLNLEGGWPAVIWSHLLWTIPYTLLVLKPAWLRLDPRYATLAHTLGWSCRKVLWLVKVPLLMRPLAGAFAVGFSVSVAQYLPTLYAGAGRFATVTTEAVALSSGGDLQQQAIQALLQMLLPALIFFITAWLSRLACRYRQGLR